MHDGELETRQDDPDDVKYQRERSARRVGLEHFTTKGRENATGNLEALEAERDADNREAQQDAAEGITEEDNESAEHEERDVAE